MASFIESVQGKEKKRNSQNLEWSQQFFSSTEPTSVMDEDNSPNMGKVDLLKQRKELSRKRKQCLVQTVSIDKTWQLVKKVIEVCYST